MRDIMLDLETMGSGPQAAIIAIGAVEFDIPARQLGERFYTVVDLESAVDQGGIMDAATVLWWMKQSDAARAAFQRPGEGIGTALYRFVAWIRGRGPRADLRVWGNGAAFDNVILAAAYRRRHAPPPWDYWNDRCYRTVKALHPDVKMQRTGDHHNAIDDAISQAQHLIAMLSPKATESAS